MDFEREAAKRWNLPGYGPPSNLQVQHALPLKPPMPRASNNLNSQAISDLIPVRAQPLHHTNRPSAPVKRGSPDRLRYPNRAQPQSPRQHAKPKAGTPRFPSRGPPAPIESRNITVNEEVATIIQGRRIPDSVISRRKEPQPEKANCKLMFHWPPQDGLTMKSCFGPDLEELDSLRKAWRVHIYMQHDLDNYICVSSDQSFDRKKMVQILRENYIEKYARHKLRIKAYMVEPLLAAEPGDKVIIAKPNGIAQPDLQKNQPNQLLSTPYRMDNLLESGLVNNHDLIRSSLDRCLSLFKYIDAQVGMRVKFGTFIMSRWKPLGDSAGYDLHKFPEILRDERWQGRVVPGLCLSQVNLIERCLQAQETLIPMGTANGLINPELSPDTMRTLHSARFEFARSEKSTSTFCLNVNFDQDHGAIESGSAQYRWFKTSTEATRQEALQLAMIDFHRSDWEIDLEFFDPIANEDISEAQETFANTVKLDPYRGSAPITSKPRRKVVFGENALISKLVQKTAIKFKVKGTDYVLELARFEESHYSSTGRTRWTPPKIQWGAILTSQKWNNLLGDHIKRLNGLGVDSLFPTPNGLKDFLETVKKISDILSPLPKPGDIPSNNEEINAVGVLDSELGALF